MKCSVVGCERKMKAKGLCTPHHSQEYRFLHKVHDRTFDRESLYQEVSALAAIPLPQSIKVVNTLISTMTKTIQKGESIFIPGLGSFGLSPKSRNQHGKYAYFIPSHDLLATINKDL